MMKLSKLIGIVVVALATLGKIYSSEISIDFMNNFGCSVECNKQGKTFWNSVELSSGINNITSDYFNTNSVSIDTVEFNTINFNAIKTVKPCSLSIKGSQNFKPKLVFNFAGNEHLSKLSIGDNISALKIKSTNNIVVNIDVLESLSDTVVETYGNVQVHKLIENPRSRIVHHGGSFVI